MTKISEIFQLKKSQAELDFVDVDTEKDTPLYIDPYAISSREDQWSQHCNYLILSYFDTLLEAVRTGNKKSGASLMMHLGEPEETMLGVSRPGNSGRGIGPSQAADLFEALSSSAAAKSGLLKDISDFALFIPNIGRDKISDMTTNIVRRPLIVYTASQCRLHGIPLSTVPSGMFWDATARAWSQDYVQLPVIDGRKILLVPKYAVRYVVGVDADQYRQKFVLNFLQVEHLRADDSLVTTLKDKKGNIQKHVYKKTLDENYPKTKDFLADFSRLHPTVIDDYRKQLKLASSKIPNLALEGITEAGLAKYLRERLAEILPGSADADNYHKLMVGVLSFLYFPNLLFPDIEARINQGRKRLDVLYTNGKESGIFYRLALDQFVLANLVHVECKNYSDDIANPEFDQLIGRLDHNRGRFGLLLYRKSDDQNAVIARARDAAKSKQGIILPLDDEFVSNALLSVEHLRRNDLDEQLDGVYRQVTS